MHNHLNREIFNFFAEHRIYLPQYQLSLIAERMDSPQAAFNDLDNYLEEYNKDRAKYSNPKKGAYTVDNEHMVWLNNCKKSVVARCCEGTEQTYPSLYAASKATGISVGNISQCVNGKRKSAGGFVWEYLK